jgi:MFS family permease
LPIFTILLCFSAFYRVTNAVIAPDLVREFNLDAERLGILGSAFFYAFAIFQIPTGILLDWVGPRKVIFFFALLGAIGAFIFASASSFYTALAGRALLGIGMAPTLLGALKVLVTTYPPKKFSTLSGIIISFGTLGSILATSPLAYLNSIIGWRLTLIYAGIITAALAFLIFWVLKDDSHEAHRDALPNVSREQDAGVMKTLQLLLCNLSFWQIGSIAFFRYGTFVALQGVWLGPYLMNIKNFTPLTTGNILMMLSLGVIAGSPVAGYLAARVFRAAKPVIMIGLICYILCLVPLTGIWNIETAFAYSVTFMLMGFFSSFGMLAYAHIKELFPLSMSGTAIAGVNFFVIAGGAVFMQIIGIIISLYADTNQTYQPGAYHLAFFVCLMGMIGSLIFYAFSKGK